MEPTTTRKHCLRSQPTPSGRSTSVTDNDIFSVFESLSQHVQLTTKQLVSLDPRYASTVRNRLTDLYHIEGERLALGLEKSGLVHFSETLKLADR